MVIKLLGFILSLLTLTIAMPAAEAAKVGKGAKETQSIKEKLVLMPMRLSEEDKSLQGAMETALVQGLQQKYEVFSGEQVAQKAREIFLKESRSTAKKECDETRCMQGIAEAFQAELIATANVTKQSAGYFLALSIQNIFDNKVVYSNSIPCRDCDAFQVVDKLKDLSEVGTTVVPAVIPPDPVKTGANANDPETILWNEVKNTNQLDDYEAYLTQYPNGKYIVLANSRIKKLKDAAISDANRKEREAWEAADKADNEDSYKSYLKGWPSGKYVGQAEARIRKLQADMATRQEDDMWQRASLGKTSQAVQAYLDYYPGGNHVAEARAKLTAIRKAEIELFEQQEQELWNKADNSDNKTVIEYYIKRYPAGRYLENANAKLQLIKDNEAKNPELSAALRARQEAEAKLEAEIKARQEAEAMAEAEMKLRQESLRK